MAINSYKHLKPGGAGLKDGSDWDNAFDEPAFETFMEATVVAGDVIFVMEGTYTLDSSIDFNARDGSAVSPIALIGVKDTTVNTGASVVYSDWARLAADKPFFDTVTFVFKTGNYTILRNLSFQGSANNQCETGTLCVVENCKFENDVGAAAINQAVKISAGTKFINNEVTGTNATGLNCAGSLAVLFNYFHDLQGSNGYGVTTVNPANVYAFNIFDNVKVGLNVGAADYHTIMNNTFYDCDVAVNFTNGFGVCGINNIVEASSTDGFKWTTQTDANFFWNNHGDDVRCNDMWDLVDTTTVFQDYEVSTGDPVFANPGADFSLQDTSPNLNNGMSIELGV